MPPFTVLIKPTSSSCNLRCRYCFYENIANSREIASYGIMNFDILEHIIKKSLMNCHQSCTFAFQGGEPTLAGIDFFRYCLTLQQKYNTGNVHIYNSIQTNGILIDNEWAEFLGDNNFLVGISLDGLKEIHDKNRVYANDKGSFSKVMHAVSLFNNYNVEYNILSVVTENMARHANKVYNFYKKNNFKYIQFIKCLDPLEEEPGIHEYSLTPQRYAIFLKNIFDLWYEDILSGNRISIREFDNFISILLGYPPEACGMTGQCDGYMVVESDGSVYPCDFYVIDRWRLGNISESTFEQLKQCEGMNEFRLSSQHTDEKCKECKYFNLCRGGCRRNREPYKNGLPVPNYYCTAYYDFFEYTADRMKRLAAMLLSKR